MGADPGNPKASKQAARDERLAAALRENLRRRKSQARARAAENGQTTAPAETARGAGAPRRESEP